METWVGKIPWPGLVISILQRERTSASFLVLKRRQLKSNESEQHTWVIVAVRELRPLEHRDHCYIKYHQDTQKFCFRVHLLYGFTLSYESHFSYLCVVEKLCSSVREEKESIWGHS